MTNDRPMACGIAGGWRAGGAVLVVLLLAACAAPLPPAADESAMGDDLVAGTKEAKSGRSTERPSALSSVKSWLWGNAPWAVDQAADDEAVGAALPPPLFTPAQVAAETAAAADLAAEPTLSGAGGGPSIRFRKPFNERGLPGGEEVDRGTASWYGLQFHGRLTANGERYDMYDLTAAHKTLPFNTIVSVHNLQTGRSVRVRINDRGPFVDGRVIDLSKAAAEQLGMAEVGLRPVSLVVEEWPDVVSEARDAKRAVSRQKKKSRATRVQVEGP